MSYAEARAPAGFTAVRRVAESAFSSVFEVASGGERGTRGICKRLTSRGLASDEACGALIREADLLERIARASAAERTPCPVPLVFARGVDTHGPFLVTRFISGTTLRDADAFADPGNAIDQARRAFAALDVVNRVGRVIHGDVHLDNVMVRDDGAVVLVDFGLATVVGEGGERDSGVPASPTFRGTALYVAPEVARGEAHGPSADRFALAAALLHRASGLPPRRGVTQAARLYESGTEPLDAWLAEIGRTKHAPLACLLAPLLSFEPAARASVPGEPRDKQAE